MTSIPEARGVCVESVLSQCEYGFEIIDALVQANVMIERLSAEQINRLLDDPPLVAPSARRLTDRVTAS